MRKRKLTAKQERFVHEYLLNPSATQAARAAGYSEKTAGQIGYDLLRTRTVAGAIAKARRERTEHVQPRKDDRG